MKSAREMFEELGYEYKEIKTSIFRNIQYKKYSKIIFFRYDKCIIPYCDYGDGEEGSALLNLKELQAINKQVEELGWNKEEKLMFKPVDDERKELEYIKSENARKINNKIYKLKSKDLIYEGMLSDTYHTFDSLYFQRMILFAVICNQNKNISWKSKKHEDGTMYDNYFIVGINTPKGTYTYHYHIQYWNYFKVKELKNAPKWDGHTDKDVIRLLSLEELRKI